MIKIFEFSSRDFTKTKNFEEFKSCKIIRDYKKKNTIKLLSICIFVTIIIVVYSRDILFNPVYKPLANIIFLWISLIYVIIIIRALLWPSYFIPRDLRKLKNEKIILQKGVYYYDAFYRRKNLHFSMPHSEMKHKTEIAKFENYTAIFFWWTKNKKSIHLIVIPNNLFGSDEKLDKFIKKITA